MIIWSGFGFVVALIGFGALLLTQWVAEWLTGDAQFYQSHGWVMLLGMLIAAGLSFGFHRLLSLQKTKVVIDKDTGQELTLARVHSLFFIPVKWWPVVFVALGLVMVVVKR